MDHGSPRDWFAVTFLGYPRTPTLHASLLGGKTEDCLNVAARLHIDLNSCR